MSGYEDMLSSDVSDDALGAAGTTTSVYLKSPPVFQQPSDVPYQLQVVNPQKQSEKTSSYVAYTLKVRKVKDGVESSSFRRYSDFLWLHDQLAQKHPSCVVPPMPEKSATGKFSPELLMYRCRELSRFAQRVAAHPILCEDEDFEFFLMAPWTDFTEKRNSTPAKSSVVGSLFGSVKSMFGGKVDDPDEWFVATASELANRKQLLSNLLESCGAMVSAWRQLGEQYNKQAAQMRALSKLLGESDGAHCTDDADATEGSVRILGELATQIEHSYLDNIRDYIREIAEVEAVLARRAVLVKEYNSLAKTAEKKGADFVAKRDEAQAALDAFSKSAQTDIQRVLDTRKGELERIAAGFAQLHQECFTQTAAAWGGVLGGEGAAAAAAAAATTTTTTASEEANPFDGEEMSPFSSAVSGGGVPSSPYAVDDE